MNEFVFFSAVFGNEKSSFQRDLGMEERGVSLFQCDRGTEERVPVFWFSGILDG